MRSERFKSTLLTACAGTIDLGRQTYRSVDLKMPTYTTIQGLADKDGNEFRHDATGGARFAPLTAAECRELAGRVHEFADERKHSNSHVKVRTLNVQHLAAVLPLLPAELRGEAIKSFWHASNAKGKARALHKVLDQAGAAAPEPVTEPAVNVR